MTTYPINEGSIFSEISNESNDDDSDYIPDTYEEIEFNQGSLQHQHLENVSIQYIMKLICCKFLKKYIHKLPRLANSTDSGSIILQLICWHMYLSYGAKLCKIMGNTNCHFVTLLPILQW